MPIQDESVSYAPILFIEVGTRKDSESPVSASATPTPSPGNGVTPPVETPAASSVASTPTAAPNAGISRGIRDFWQVPLLATGVAGIVAALYYARAHPPQDDFAGALAQAEELVNKGELDAAKVVLFDVVGANLEKAPPELLPRFHAVGADYVAAKIRGVDRPGKDSDAQVVTAYDKAKASGWTLTSEQLIRYAESLVRLERAQEAFAAISAAGNTEQADALRRQVRREALLGVLGSPTAGVAVRAPETLLAAIDEFRADPALSVADEAWAAARAAELRIGMERFADASDRLLLDLRRIESASSDQVGENSTGATPQAFAELSGLLAEALRRQGRFIEAQREFEHAHQLVRAGTPVAGAIDVGLGRTLLALKNSAEAKDVFDRAVLAQHDGAVGHNALLGRAQSRSEIGDADGATRDFSGLRGAIRRGDLDASMINEVERVLLERADAALVAEAPAEALAYAEIAVDLGRVGGASAAALLRVATSSREEANRMLKAAKSASPMLVETDPEDRAKINRLLKRAGDAFASHAATPQARAAQDGTYTASLWAAADSYDLAGWREAAIANFQAYLDATQPDNLDRAEAFWRLAVLNHAEGAFADAAKFYASAIAVSPKVYQGRSIVPLARALASSGRVADAMAQLQTVIDGAAGLKPSADEYFEALDVYARLCAQKEDFVRSAELLREAVARRPENPRVGELSFRLGESLRAVARASREQSESADVSVARRVQLADESQDRLKEARRAFEGSILALEARSDTLDGLSRDMLREAHLGRAHSAFDLAQYEDSISLYEAVDRKYPEHASSMIALIQIVNACDALGDNTRADTAHRRAQLRLAQLPDDAFLVGGGILARESWERWLHNHPPSGSRLASEVPSAKEAAQ
ncbi:MAG: hypothetical protein DWH97_12245 [Planctomycetota bacterium]|jgi:tetratricopeptide (TPR) repeat protein|nr:MAG: hypothetical protein DWH97_12245 [Planctomycetota bacterium]RLS96985.1 MAG: hypothetical protein DWI12_00695 [Planctomycetota bacterium]